MSNECLQCKSNENLKLCGSCKKAYFCSVECQKKSWKNHKLVCKNINNYNQNINIFEEKQC